MSPSFIPIVTWIRFDTSKCCFKTRQSSRILITTILPFFRMYKFE